MLLLCELQHAYDTWYETPADWWKTRGRALIIANSSFVSATLSARHGTDVDVKNLRTVFEWLKFDVDVRKNLTSQVRYIYLSKLIGVVVSMCALINFVADFVHTLVTFHWLCWSSWD